MIRPSGQVRIHLYRQPVDMRKAINGLVSIVEGEMEADPFSADLYIFCNRTRTPVKMVAWEGNGVLATLHVAAEPHRYANRSVPGVLDLASSRTSVPSNLAENSAIACSGSKLDSRSAPTVNARR